MKSPLSGYVGGKSRLVKKILERIPDHTCYAEPFAGAAWPLFAKDPSKVEVLNDVNSDLVTLYRVIQHHLEELVRQFKWLLCSREEFERQKKVRPETLTDIQKAARFYYQLKLSFGGRVASPTFGRSVLQPPRLNLLRIEEELSAAHIRLSRVYIENMSYAELIRRYDRLVTFFYLDPPYMGCETDYGKNVFGPEDFARLAELLNGLQGRFLLSLNDTPEVRQIFGAFNIEAVTTTYSVANGSRTPAKEVFITNY